MRFRKLRIAWAVACGIACVLLVVLWVRSYWRNDLVRLQTAPPLHVNSERGVFQVSVTNLFQLPTKSISEFDAEVNVGQSG
jgi:hypothetical protein